MNLFSLSCPNCSAKLDIEDGIDTFFCKYCGHKIILEGQSDAAYKAKTSVKQMEHEQTLQDKHDAQKRYEIESKQNDEKRTALFIFALFGSLIILFSLMSLVGNACVNKQERELQAIVDEIMVDIENENFADAYIKANSLYWDDSYTSEGEEKWDAIREEIIDQIEAAEKEATGHTTNNSFWDWFD